MSDQSGTPPDPPEQELSAEQEQMLRQMEEEMRQLRIQDLIGQSVVSIINLAFRRIAKEDERDLDQGRIGIDAVRALVDLLEPEQQTEVRNALSQVQMAYAQAAGEPGGGGEDPGASGQGGQGGGSGPGPGGPGPGAGGEGQKKPPPGLWVPGS